MTFEEHVLALELRGYTIVEDLLTPEECAEGRRELERILREESGTPDRAERPARTWAYTLMNKARVFERPYQIPELLRLIRRFLGADAVLQCVQGNIVWPGTPAQKLHFDGSLTGPFSSFASDMETRIVGHVLGFNVIFALTEFTRENGATRVVPGSHRMPARSLPEGPPPGEVIVEARPGSALIFNIATWHAASPHRGAEPRLALLTSWRRSWIRPEVDLSRMVDADVLERAGPEGRTIFGFVSRPPYVERWRWDHREGRPKAEWRHLERDEPDRVAGDPENQR